MRGVLGYLAIVFHLLVNYKLNSRIVTWIFLYDKRAKIQVQAPKSLAEVFIGKYMQ
jgi:hypothetical protein